jgi:hypothetical protein
MMSESEARQRAYEFAQRKIVSKGYTLQEVPARQVSETDWAFAYVMIAPSGARSCTQIVLVDKSTGRARTLRDAIGEGWRGQPKR